MSTLNKFISYQILLIILEGANNEPSSKNNQSTCGTPPSSMRGFFNKKAFRNNSEEGWLGYLFSCGNSDIEISNDIT